MSKETRDDVSSRSETRIVFDLSDELAPAEIEQFHEAAAAAGAPSLTEHFLNLTLRHTPEHAA